MDDFSFIIEIIISILDAFFTSADVYSWFKGRQNRVQRKEAWKRGTPIPPRDIWNRRVVFFTIAAFILTIILIVWRQSRRLNG